MPAYAALIVSDLVKEFRRGGAAPIRAVDGLSFEIARGSIFGLLGPNGAGKTTTLRILTTLIAPTSGRASVLGWDTMQHPLEVRRRIAVVIQDHAADLLLSVRDNLITFARFHGLHGPLIRHRAVEVMEQFGLLDEASRKVQDLSGGFRRRVQVAKVFMVETPVVFLDEFSTGMDPLLKRAIMDRLRQAAAADRTIVLTTQVLSEAEELCDDILIMNRGRQVARGDLHALKLLSAGVYELTVTFDTVPEDLERTVDAWRPLRYRQWDSTVQVALKGQEGQVLELANALARRSRIVRLEVSGASLEDVFIELMQRD